MNGRLTVGPDYSTDMAVTCPHDASTTSFPASTQLVLTTPPLKTCLAHITGPLRAVDGQGKGLSRLKEPYKDLRALEQVPSL